MHVRSRLALAEHRGSRPASVVPGGTGRLPLSCLLPLLAGLAACALLPGPAGPVAVLLTVILLGVPHGALDGEVARPVLRPRAGRAWFAVFAIPYLGLAALVLLAWHLFPIATLAAFLAVSVFHFGEEDAGTADLLELVARGGLPIALPVLLHPAGTAGVLGTIALVPLAAVPGWLHAAALAWVPLALFCGWRLWRARRRATLAEMGGLALVFAALPPLAAFAFYFVGFHAPRHVAGLVRDTVRAPRVRTVRQAVLRSIPVTLLTLLLGAALWRLYPGPPAERLLSVTLQGLAALTLPHLLLSHAPLPPAAPAAPRGMGAPRP